jgi:tetratricopeptide (TPR) repeat protein
MDDINGIISQEEKEDVQKRIYTLKNEENNSELKAFLLSCIEKYPDEYYFYTELSACCYCLDQPAESLKYAEKAIELKGKDDDVWVNFHYGMALTLNDKYDEAIVQFDKILRKRISTIAYNEHGEGMKFAKGIVMDAKYMKGRSLMETGNYAKAKKLIKEHLAMRQRGTYTSFYKHDAEMNLKKLEKLLKTNTKNKQ